MISEPEAIPWGDPVPIGTSRRCPLTGSPIPAGPLHGRRLPWEARPPPVAEARPSPWRRSPAGREGQRVARRGLRPWDPR